MLVRGSALAVFAVAVVTALLGGCRPPNPETPPGVEIPMAASAYVLTNGLTIIEQPDPTAPDVAVRLRISVGAKDDPPTRRGLAHLVQHLVLAPSRRTKDLDHHATIFRLGAGRSLVTGTFGLEHSDFGGVVPRSNLAVLLWLEADRLGSPLFDTAEEELRRERNVVLAERAASDDADSAAALRAIAQQEAFGVGHPYATTLQCVPSEIEPVTLEEARQFAEAHYRPDRATLIVSGAFEPAVLRPLIGRFFGPIRSRRGPLHAEAPPASIARERTVRVATTAPGPVLVVAWVGPPPNSDGYLELELAVAELSRRSVGSFVSGTPHLAERATFTIGGGGRAGSLVTATIHLRAGAQADEALRILDDLVTATSQLGRLITWDAFGGARATFAAARIQMLEQPANRTGWLAHQWSYRGQVGGFESEVERLYSVRASDVGTAVEQFLRDKQRIIVIGEPTTSGAAPIAGARP